jgi:DnaJ-class molecular chaperone
MYYDKDGVLRNGWTGKEIKRGNVQPPPPPPKKAQQYIKVDLQTATNTARDEILPGQCPACYGYGNVMVSHINECSACNGTGKTSPVA